MKTWGLFLILAAATATAGITITAKPGDWVLRRVVAGAEPVSISRHPTLAACQAATPAAGLFRCDTSVNITAVDSCVGVKAPPIPLVKNAAGFVEEPDAFAELVDGQWVTLQDLYVRAPVGAVECWVRGHADPREWRVNGTNPDAVFMERLEPGMPPLADAPNIQEPVYWPAELIEKWNNPESVAARALP